MQAISQNKSTELFNHQLFAKIKTIEECRIFMEHHIFAVWDFMSLAKKVQEIFAPIKTPWEIPIEPKYTRFINEIILSEESDQLEDGRVMSHCEMYLEAMREIGASTQMFEDFLRALQVYDLHSIDVRQFIPDPAYEFMKHTFSIVNSKQPHMITASFCYGRENIIPGMFLSLLDSNGITNSQAPIMREYLKKHIDLDGDIHGPMAIQMTEYTCQNINQKKLEVEATKLHTIQARIRFWDGIYQAINEKDRLELSV